MCKAHVGESGTHETAHTLLLPLFDYSLQHGDHCQEDCADYNTSGINAEIKVNGQKLKTVTSSKYLGSPGTDEGSEPEIHARIAQMTAAITRLKPVWNDRSISFSSKI